MKPVSVTQVNEYIAGKLRSDLNLKDLPVEGEVSGVSESRGHIYFSLKDNESIMRCAVWASNRRKMNVKLIENGKKIIAVGDISPYAKGGSYSFSIRYVEAYGEGALMAEFNRIKTLLQNEGLFDSKYKKPLPKFPKTVGVVTSSTGAAIEDIKKIITSKNTYTNIIIFPTVVQGAAAPASICENIRLANELNSDGEREIDVLIVGRGGGSAEDLAAFNDEQVAREIFASVIPVISAVGHESDFSISDFVADVRAETPTAAADMAVADTFDLTDDIARYRSLLSDAMRRKVEIQRQQLSGIAALAYSNMTAKLQLSKMTVEKAILSLNENNPRNILRKGYAAVLDNEGHVISDINSINTGEEYDILLRNGIFKAKAGPKERRPE